MQVAERQILLAANIIRRIREMVADQGCAYAETSLSEIVNDALSLIAVANEYPSLILTPEIGRAADVVGGDKGPNTHDVINVVRNACDADEGVDNPRVVLSRDSARSQHVSRSGTYKGQG